MTDTPQTKFDDSSPNAREVTSNAAKDRGNSRTFEQRIAALENCVLLHDRLSTLESRIAKVTAGQGGSAQQPPSGSGWFWMFFGFGALGGGLGFIAGLTVTQGVGQALLTGALSFAGGTLLGFAGFRRSGGTEPHHIDPAHLGGVVAAFSSMIVVGLVLGICSRTHRWLAPEPSEQTKVSGPIPSSLDSSAKAGQVEENRNSKASVPALLPVSAPASSSSGDEWFLRAQWNTNSQEKFDSMVASWGDGGSGSDVGSQCLEFFRPMADGLARCGVLHFPLSIGADEDFELSQHLFGLSLELDCKTTIPVSVSDDVRRYFAKVHRLKCGDGGK